MNGKIFKQNASFQRTSFMIRLMKKTSFLILFFIANQLCAQMVGGQIFLQGMFAEVGISQCGVYGASSSPPGYNGNLGGPLGFVADHEMDGWNVSSPTQPVRCGDYFYPGSPYEAWGIEINGTTYANYNTFSTCDGVIGGGITGSCTFYSAAGGKRNGQWEGDIIAGSTNLHICQYTSVPDSQLYFSTTISLTNNGSTPLTNVYYIRHLDPDNEQVYSGVFETNNTVVQNPTATVDKALCTATGQLYGCFLGMLSTGYPDARAFIGGSVGSFPVPISNTWNGNTAAGYDTTTGSTNGGIDDCMGITNYWSSIAPGQTVKFKFYYVLDPSAIADALNASQTIDVSVNGIPASIEGGGSMGAGACSEVVTTDTINLKALFCPNDPIRVDINATFPYNWSWPLTPEISLLDASGDSVLINSMTVADSVIYTANGVYNVGVDTSFVVLILTLVEEEPDAEFTYDTVCVNLPACFNDNSTTIAGSTITDYEWNFDEGGLMSFAQDTCVLLQNETLHNITLTVTTANGCTNTDTVQIIPNNVPVQLPLLSLFICEGYPLVLSNDSSIGDSYLWNTGDTTNTLTITTSGLYTLVVTNECGSVVDSFDVVLLPDLNNLILPNVLTANNDGVNDEYIISELALIETYQLDFYNRWGVHVFSTTDVFGNPWRGTTGDNGPLVPGQYFVVLKAFNCDGNEVSKTQFITIFE